ncbi:hypothetical protein NLG97_g4828 [Lecanicillium saksenae]|uniref:Uncharacterized protein n=1 Tax=Lecanicillium saksenae TaxID=468837 RepID=A0ACC1QWR0_9HYPO|nr:hypothetical protein NLG97_g4828 [Lecanicillium saksenae]
MLAREAITDFQVTYACQIVATWAATETTQRFNTALSTTATGILALIITGFGHQLGETTNSSDLAFWISTLVANLSVIGVLLLTPRSLDKHLHGRAIDRQQSASLFELATFSWPYHAFIPSRLRSLTVKQLPYPPIHSCAAHLADTYAIHARNHRGRSLGYLLFRTHVFGIALQWILVAAKSSIILIPDYVQYRLLQWLGSNREPGVYGPGLRWALALGLSKSFDIIVSAWLEWTTESMVRAPIITTLRTLVHRKAMYLPAIVDDAAKGRASPLKEVIVEMRSHWTSYFFTDSHEIALALAKLISTACFLVMLVGWRCLAAGVVASALVLPLNTYLAKRYALSQAAATSLSSKRSATLTTALHAMRQIKLAAAEGLWVDKLRGLRRDQMKQRLNASLWMSAVVFSANISPTILAGVPVYIFTMSGQSLTADIAFTTISLFDSMQGGISLLPRKLPYTLDNWRSLCRLSALLQTTELSGKSVKPASTVALRSATAKWYCNRADDERHFALDNLTIEFPDGEVSVITGNTGSGKSLLLAAIAGEARLASGSIHRPWKDYRNTKLGIHEEKQLASASLAVVTQSPWMDNATIRDNILFGLPYEEDRYHQAVYSCALKQDFDQLKDGDASMVGIKGVTLSGGQRWRVALARALYSYATLILLDDVLSAVDTEVRDWIVEKALFGDLRKGRTCILATHHAKQCLAKAGYHVHLKDGKAVSQRCLASSTQAAEKSQKIEPEALGHVDAQQQDAAEPTLSSEHQREEKGQILKSKSKYRAYFEALGGSPVVLAAVLAALMLELIPLAQSWQLKEWSTSKTALEQPHTSHGLRYMASAAAHCVGVAAWNYFRTILGVNASQRLFDTMSASLFGAPLQWLEEASHGEITNRFSSDIRAADLKLPNDLGLLLKSGFQLVAILIASNMSLSTRDIMVIAALLYCYTVLTRQSKITRKTFTSLSSTATASLYQHLSSLQAPDAVSTIRAYGKIGHYTRVMYQLIDDCSAASWSEALSRIMIDFRAKILGVIFVTYSAMCVVLLGTEAGAAGVALAFALRFGTVTARFLQRITTIESGFDSIERIVEYCNLPQEPKSGTQPPDSWPTAGRVSITGLTAGYKPSLPPALENISFSVNPGRRVGVVGRTGAGKSSLTLAFARLINFRGGEIIIDGVDISHTRTDSLRKGLLIIPQDPYLFAGCLRTLLDPEGLHDDELLTNCLRRVGLSRGTASLHGNPMDLSFQLEDGGSNISQGQRQMLYLAKALISGKKLIIMDEATSSVDAETDVAIQAAIRAALPNTTMIVVAHRLATIVDFDTIVVLADGKIVEVGPPKTLYQQRGAFFNLISHSPDRQELIVRMTDGDGEVHS